MTEQQIRVPIVSDAFIEPAESFRVTLRDSQGGAGLGTTAAIVQIAADGGPFGQFNFREALLSVEESTPYAQLAVSRLFYSSGPVSVTLTPLAGTAAAGADFVADPITLTWADGEGGVKLLGSRSSTIHNRSYPRTLRCGCRIPPAAQYSGSNRSP